VVTDNKALSFFLSQTNLPYHQTRWRMFLQSYDFNIIHRPGKDNVLADALSRIYEEREASADMILVDPTEKTAIKGLYYAMTRSVKHNLDLAHTLDPVNQSCFFSTTPLDPFSLPQHLSMWNIEHVPIPDSPKEKEKDHHPGPFEQGLHKMATTLEEAIDAMQSNKASTQGQPHDRYETTIFIQAAQTQLVALASRIHSPSNQIERSLRLNAITNCFGTIDDSITKLESIALASSGYETTPSVPPSNPPREELERFLMSTGHRAKHCAQCVWEECESHMEGKLYHYYPSGPRHIPTPCPLYSPSCFITAHYPKRGHEDRWAIPPAFTNDDGYPVSHTINNKHSGPTSNHSVQKEDLPVPDVPVDYDDPFPNQPSTALDMRAFQLSQHLKGKWYNNLRKPQPQILPMTSSARTPTILVGSLLTEFLLKRGEDASRDCPYLPYEAAYEGTNIRSEIIRITHEKMAHMGAHKCFKYASQHFYWMSMRSDFKDYIRRCHLCQMNKQPTTLPDGVVTPLPVPREPFFSLAIDFEEPFPNDNKKELILVVLERFIGFTYLITVSQNITAVETANLLIERIFSVHTFPTSIVSDRDPKFTSRIWM